MSLTISGKSSFNILIANFKIIQNCSFITLLLNDTKARFECFHKYQQTSSNDFRRRGWSLTNCFKKWELKKPDHKWGTKVKVTTAEISHQYRISSHFGHVTRREI